MATNYPTSLDTTTELPNRSASDELDDVPAHSLITTNVNQAVIALEAKVGVTSSAVTTSHDYRIAQLEGTGALTMAEGDAIDMVESGGTLTLHSIPSQFAFATASLTWTNQPSAVTELAGNTLRRRKGVLTHATQARIIVTIGGTAANTGATMAGQYSTDGTTWAYLDGATGPSVSITTVDSLQVSSWVTLTGAAKADVFLRIVGAGGDGVIDPIFGLIELQVR
jgi:hypothetical protein